MAIGTAGFTSMLAVMALEEHGLKPGSDVCVTGAAGGVGSVAVAILAKLGHSVAASTGRKETHDYLKSLGAKTILDRAELGTAPTRPLGSERFAGAVDSVGGDTLANLLTQMKYGSSVSACGLAGGAELKTTVIPFLLRGVNLLGIDSVMCPKARREAAWARLAKDLPMAALDSTITEAKLEDLPALGSSILKGQVRGRTVRVVEGGSTRTLDEAQTAGLFDVLTLPAGVFDEGLRREGEAVATIHSRTPVDASDAVVQSILDAITWADRPVVRPALVIEVVR